MEDEEWHSVEEDIEQMSEMRKTASRQTTTNSDYGRGRFTDLEWLPEDIIKEDKAAMTGGWSGDDEGGFTKTWEGEKSELDDIAEIGRCRGQLPLEGHI